LRAIASLRASWTSAARRVAAALGAQPRASLTFASVLQFHAGRAGAGLAPFGIAAAAVVPLAIALYWLAGRRRMRSTSVTARSPSHRSERRPPESS